MEMKSIVDLWKRSRLRGEEIYLATVVHVRGSSYRKSGARMLITASGERAGSISGGCLEAEVSKKISWMTASGRVIQSYQSSFDDDNEGVPYGLGCGGTIWILMERGAAARAVLNALERAFENGGAAVVISDLRMTTTSETRIVPAEFLEEPPYATDGTLSQEDYGAAKLALTTARSVRSKETSSEGLPFVLYMPICEPLQLHIFGAGDDVQPLCRLASELGWHTTVWDGRAHLLRSDRFPQARELKLLQYSEPASGDGRLRRNLLEAPTVKTNDFAVILTHSYEQDQALLRCLLPQPIRYLGILGPLHRTSRLVAEVSPYIGLHPSECLERLHAPVGIPIGGSDPASIALSIVAEMQAVATIVDPHSFGVRFSWQPLPSLQA